MVLTVPFKKRIKLFLRAVKPHSILKNLKWLTIGVFDGDLKIADFKKLVNKKELTWEKVVGYCKNNETFKKTAIRFYYLTKIQWAVTQDELINVIINSGGSDIGITKTDIVGIFDGFERGYSWENILENILGRHYTLKGFGTYKDRKVTVIGRVNPNSVPIYIEPEELLVRVLLMGNDVDAPAVGRIMQLYNGEAVSGDKMSYANKKWFKIKRSMIIGLQQTMKNAVKLFLNKELNAEWKKWHEKKRFCFVFRKNS